MITNINYDIINELFTIIMLNNIHIYMLKIFFSSKLPHVLKIYLLSKMKPNIRFKRVYPLNTHVLYQSSFKNLEYFRWFDGRDRESFQGCIKMKTIAKIEDKSTLKAFRTWIKMNRHDRNILKTAHRVFVVLVPVSNEKLLGMIKTKCSCTWIKFQQKWIDSILLRYSSI